MKLPAKIEYAYKAVLELAIRYNGDRPTQINALSKAQGIPKKFLVQLLLRMKNAGIVDSSRGMAGGYYLARSPSRISLADVFKAIDETIIESPKKTKHGKTADADRLLLKTFAGIEKDIAERLEAVTFDKLVNQVKDEQLTYYI